MCMYLDRKHYPTTPIPQKLVERMVELDKIAGTDDWYAFESLRDLIEINTKSLLYANKITEKDLDSIFKRYGLR